MWIPPIIILETHEKVEKGDNSRISENQKSSKKFSFFMIPEATCTNWKTAKQRNSNDGDE